MKCNRTLVMDLLVYLNHLNFGYNRRKHLRDFCILVREASAIFILFIYHYGKKLEVIVALKEEGRVDLSIHPCLNKFKYLPQRI